VDELWHAAILDTQMYADLQSALGLTLHHRPSGASQQESELREKRLTAMKAMYSAFFSTEPLGSTPPQPSRLQLAVHRDAIQIFIHTYTGKTVEVNVDRQATFGDVMRAFEKHEGISMKEHRLMYNNTLVCSDETDMTVEGYGVENGDTLELYQKQTGC